MTASLLSVAEALVRDLQDPQHQSGAWSQRTAVVIARAAALMPELVAALRKHDADD